jgi:hypothetical protein
MKVVSSLVIFTKSFISIIASLVFFFNNFFNQVKQNAHLAILVPFRNIPTKPLVMHVLVERMQTNLGLRSVSNVPTAWTVPLAVTFVPFVLLTSI